MDVRNNVLLIYKLGKDIEEIEALVAIMVVTGE